MEFRYCPECGTLLSGRTIGDEGKVPYCEACSRPWFGLSYPCVICLVTDEDGRIALIRQSYVSECFACVAGYIKPGETAEQAAVREVAEETGLDVFTAEYISSYYHEKNDNLMLGFVGRVRGSAFQLSEEVDEACWFSAGEAEKRMRTGSIAARLLSDYVRRYHIPVGN